MFQVPISQLQQELPEDRFKYAVAFETTLEDGKRSEMVVPCNTMKEALQLIKENKDVALVTTHIETHLVQLDPKGAKEVWTKGYKNAKRGVELDQTELVHLYGPYVPIYYEGQRQYELDQEAKEVTEVKFEDVPA